MGFVRVRPFQLSLSLSSGKNSTCLTLRRDSLLAGMFSFLDGFFVDLVKRCFIVADFFLAFCNPPNSPSPLPATHLLFFCHFGLHFAIFGRFEAKVLKEKRWISLAISQGKILVVFGFTGIPFAYTSSDFTSFALLTLSGASFPGTRLDLSISHQEESWQ